MKYVNDLGSEQENQLIQRAFQRNQLTGSARFIDEVESRLGVRIEQKNQGVSQLDFIFLNAYALTHGKITPNRYSQPANAYHASWQ